MKMHGLAVLFALALAPAAWSQSPPLHRWPDLEEQLAGERVPRGSALERLIRDNQDFALLRPEEAGDKIRVPLWLRVFWRKAHPEGIYLASDPTGGYPLVLKEVAEWMFHHPDLRPAAREKDVPPELFKATAGTNLRISGAAGNARSESDIRINFNNPLKVIAASNNIVASGHQAQYWSLDGGATWGQTTLPFTGSDASHSDPTVDWTSDGTAWSTTIGIQGGSQLRMRSYKSVDSGATWTFDATFSGTQTSTDKQIMWVDHSATSAFKDNIYVCWHNGLPQFVNRRTGPAGAWQTATQVSGAETTGTAIGCDVKTNSAGDVFVTWPDTGSRGIYRVKSTNGGVSWSARVKLATTIGSFDIGVPSFNGRRMLIYATTGAYRSGPLDNVYAAYNDLSGDAGCTTAGNEPGANAASTCKSRIWFTRSTDGGATWSAPVKINNPAGLNDQFNPWLAVDETNGRIGIMYYDTVADATRKKTHVYYQSSSDNGSTWSAALQVSSAQTDETVAGADSGNQYGDYNSLSGFNGTYFPSWTDRRSAAREEIWTANINDGGAPCTPPAAPTGLTATAAGANQVNLAWSAVAGATSYNVYRSTTSGGPYTLAGSSGTTSFSNTGLACNTTYFYVVTAVLGCESANSAQASATTAACPACTTQTLYSHNFDAATGLDGFSTGTFLAGGSTVDWRGVQTCTAASGTRIFRFGGNSCTANYGNNRFAFAQPNGAGGVAVPLNATTTRLTFKHRRAFESGFDGGTVAASLDGSSYTLVPATAILAGTASYNGTTSTSCPPTGGGGVSVFTGVSTSFSTTTVDLDAVCNLISGTSTGCANRAVRIAFTSISDCTVNDDGWFLDDVSVTACVP